MLSNISDRTEIGSRWRSFIVMMKVPTKYLSRNLPSQFFYCEPGSRGPRNGLLWSLRQITTFVLCSQSPLNLHQFYLTRFQNEMWLELIGFLHRSNCTWLCCLSCQCRTEYLDLEYVLVQWLLEALVCQR